MNNSAKLFPQQTEPIVNVRIEYDLMIDAAQLMPQYFITVFTIFNSY